MTNETIRFIGFIFLMVIIFFSISYIKNNNNIKINLEDNQLNKKIKVIKDIQNNLKEIK